MLLYAILIASADTAGFIIGFADIYCELRDTLLEQHAFIWNKRK